MKNKGDEAQTVCDSNYCLISGNRVINRIPNMNLNNVFWTILNIQFSSLIDDIICLQSIIAEVVSQVTVNQNSAMLRTMEI